MTRLLVNFLTKDLADLAFEFLSQDLDWQRRDTAPRSEYWTNTFDRSYTYGKGAGERTYEAQPGHPMIDHINTQISSVAGVPLYEGCFLNFYKDGSDALGWHADDDPGIDHDRPIAVVTLGAARTLQTKLQVPGSHPQSVLLVHGSLFLMPPGFQQTHYHRIPKIDQDIGPRISLTYRGLK